MPNIAFDDLTAELPPAAMTYLKARGFKTTKLLALVASTEDVFVEKIVDPFVVGFVGSHGALHQHIGDAALLRAQLVCVWSDAREA
eukprot:926493-Heterocapsa_arctica.AAC.1